MSLDTAQLADNMTLAMHDALSEQWPQIRQYTETEAKKFAECFSMVEKLTHSGEIGNEEAEIHLNIQKNASRLVLLTVGSLGIVAVEAAINAALETVKETVNVALDYKLV